MSHWTWVAAAVMLAACENRPAERAGTVGAAAGASADSLAVTAPGRVEIWFTLARAARLPDGRPCIDRAIELRHGASRTPVPLLYTGETPTIVNDSTARAVLYTGCRAGDAYLVDLRTGRPTREHR